MIIRAYKNTDSDDVIRLWQECGLVKPWNDPGKDIERKQGVDPELFLVGMHKGMLAATVMAGYEGHRGWINYLAVAPNLQNNGLGREMMKEAERLLLARGCPKINLQVRADNEAIIAFYKAIGYGVDEVISLGKRLENDE